MESYPESYIVDGTSIGNSTLERATLTRCPKKYYSSSNKPLPSKREVAGSGENSAFWTLIGVMILLAAGNLFLTIFTMGVLRLGTGMESIEFIPGEKLTKFFGLADLGSIQHKTGIIYSYADRPFTIISDDSKISLSLRTKMRPPVVEIGPEQTEVLNVEEFKVLDPHSGKRIFSTKFPDFTLPKGVKNLNVKRSRTAKVSSPSYSNLEIRSDSTIRLKGNEGLHLEGKKVTWAADQDIYLNTLNGSIVLESGNGIYVEVNDLPLAGEANYTKGRGQYKLCVCLPQGQVFRVPVPLDNNQRTIHTRINCSSFNNPCMKS